MPGSFDANENYFAWQLELDVLKSISIYIACAPKRSANSLSLTSISS